MQYRCENANVPASSDRFSARHSAKLNARCTGRESILNPGLSSPQFYELSTSRMVNLPATDATSVADQPSPLGSGRRNARLSPSPVPCPAGSPTCGAFYCLRFGDPHPRLGLGIWNAASADMDRRAVYFPTSAADKRPSWSRSSGSKRSRTRARAKISKSISCFPWNGGLVGRSSPEGANSGSRLDVVIWLKAKLRSSNFDTRPLRGATASSSARYVESEPAQRIIVANRTRLEVVVEVSLRMLIPGPALRRDSFVRRCARAGNRTPRRPGSNTRTQRPATASRCSS